MKLHALWWWIDRWRKSTAYTDLTVEEQGAYRNLIDEAHLRGGALPNNERILARVCGDSSIWERVRNAVMAHFTLRADGWHQPTLDKIRAESARLARKQKRYRKRQRSGNDGGNAAGNDGGNKARSPSPSQSVRTGKNQPQGARTSLQQPRRRDAAWEGARALSVPQPLHADFVQYLNKPEAEQELLRWYEAVAEDYAHGTHKATPTGADMFAFWRDRFNEQWPRPAKATGGRKRPAWAIEAES